MAELILHCPECWGKVEISESRRVHRCTRCGSLGYCNSGGSSRFLYSLKGNNSFNAQIRQLAGQEELLIQELHGHQETELKMTSNFKEMKKKGRSTKRIIALTIMILALTGFIMFFDMQSVKSSFIPVFILGFLLGLSLLVLIIQKSGVSVVKNNLIDQLRTREDKEKDLHAIQERMDGVMADKFGK